MKQNPSSERDEGAERSIAASPYPCPYAAECRRHWTHIANTETAACGHCYQVLTRGDLIRVFAGPS